MAGFRKWSQKFHEKAIKALRSSSSDSKEEAPLTPKSAANEELAGPSDHSIDAPSSASQFSETPPTTPAKSEAEEHGSPLPLTSPASSPRYSLFPGEKLSVTKRLPPTEVIRLARERRLKEVFGKDAEAIES